MPLAADNFAAAEETSAASSCKTAAARRRASSACFHCFCSIASRTAGMALASVSGVNAGRVDLMFIPKAARQTFRRSQLSFALNQHFVDLGHGPGGERLTAVCFRGVEGFLILRGAMRKRVGAILNRREIQIRRHVLFLRRNVGFLCGIGAGGKNAFIDLEVALTDFVPLLCGKNVWSPWT